MGYVSKDIANITEPKQVTLAALPNFVQFASKPGVKSFYEFNVQVNLVATGGRYDDFTWIDDSRYDSTTGLTYAAAGNARSTAAPIDPVAVPFITVTSINDPTFHTGHVFYDANMTFISGFGNTNTGSVVNPTILTYPVPDNARFVAFTWTTVAYGETDKFVVTTFNLPYLTELRIQEPSGVVHIFHGTIDPVQVGGSTFYISDDRTETASNLRESLLNNTWIATNFDIRIPFIWLGITPQNGRVLSLKSKGTGEDYNLIITAPNNGVNVVYTLTPINTDSENNDSISGEASTAEIEIDVYTDPVVFLGQDDRPITNEQIGNYAVSLQKTYAGKPLWFELNSVFQHFAGFTIPPDVPGWFNTGTVRSYRFIAKKKALTSFPFYVSAAMFVINGYSHASDEIDMSDYMYGTGAFKLLTNRPHTNYVRGQKAYLNFIFRDPQRGLPGAPVFTVRVAYRAYTTSGEFLGVMYAHDILNTALYAINTCVLNIDSVLTSYPTAGQLRISLARGTSILTNDIVYTVLPECLHKLTQFVFLNKLGGWDVFNFDALPENEIKPEIETFKKTITPSYKRGESIETVYSTTLENPYTVTGAPVTDEVAEWLKELAAARVILDGDGNYVVIEDFKAKTTPESQNMQVPQIKYHRSETFTND